MVGLVLSNGVCGSGATLMSRASGVRVHVSGRGPRGQSGSRG